MENEDSRRAVKSRPVCLGLKVVGFLVLLFPPTAKVDTEDKIGNISMQLPYAVVVILPLWRSENVKCENCSVTK